MTMKRPFSQLELKLMNSEWNFVHPGGSFAIEFRADSVNSCESAASKPTTQYPLTCTLALVRRHATSLPPPQSCAKAFRRTPIGPWRNYL